MYLYKIFLHTKFQSIFTLIFSMYLSVDDTTSVVVAGAVATIADCYCCHSYYYILRKKGCRYTVCRHNGTEQQNGFNAFQLFCFYSFPFCLFVKSITKCERSLFKTEVKFNELWVIFSVFVSAFVSWRIFSQRGIQELVLKNPESLIVLIKKVKKQTLYKWY